MEPKNPTALFIHDLEYFAEPFSETWTRRGVPTKPIGTAAEALQFIRSPGIRHITAVIIHKDLGQYSGEKISLEKVVDALRDVNERIRIGIGSGEYPDGSKHVLSVGADFYFSTNEIRFEVDWILGELSRGYVMQNEFDRRGKFVETPSNTPGGEMMGRSSL